jgi:hypothetical protein
MKKIIFSFMVLVFAFASADLWAKGTSRIKDEFSTAYPPAIWYEGFESAYNAPDLSRVKGYVVVMKGGLPAQRAAFYISWGDYDYRGVTIDGDKVSTRRDSVYAFLNKGDVLAITDTDSLGRTLYMKLMTPEVYIPENRASLKHHSRVTLEACFKLPKDVFKADDPAKAMELLGEWFKPFKSYEEAKSFAAQMTNDKAQMTK